MAIQQANIPTARASDFEVGAVQQPNIVGLAIDAFRQGFGSTQQMIARGEELKAARERRNYEATVMRPIEEAKAREDLARAQLMTTAAAAKNRQSARQYEAANAQIVSSEYQEMNAENYHNNLIGVIATAESPGADVAESYKLLQELHDTLPARSPRKSAVAASLTALAGNPVVAESLRVRNVTDAMMEQSAPLDVPPEIAAEIDRIAPLNLNSSASPSVEAIKNRTAERQAAVKKWRESQMKSIGQPTASAAPKSQTLSPSMITRIATSDNVPPAMREKAQSTLQNMINGTPVRPVGAPAGPGLFPAPATTQLTAKDQGAASFFD
jgi:hypothetical protein